MKMLVIAFALLQIGDISTTLYILSHGGVELNTITNTLVHSWYYIPVKMLTVVCAVTLLVLIKDKPKLRKPLVVGLGCVVIYMGVVVAFNLIQIVLFKAGKIY